VLHYLSFFSLAKCMQAAAAAAAATAHATNAHAFFYLSPNACMSPITQCCACNECMQRMHTAQQRHEQSLSLSLLLSLTYIKHFFLHYLWIQCGLTDSRLSYRQSDPGSIPAIDKLFSINCETLNFSDFVLVILFWCFCLGIGFGDIAPVNEKREEGKESCKEEKK
jgi:hypothetical protein